MVAKSQLPADKQQLPLLLPLDDWCLTWSCGWHRLDCSIWATCRNNTNISADERRMIFRQDGCQSNRWSLFRCRKHKNALRVSTYAMQRVVFWKQTPSPTNTTENIEGCWNLTYIYTSAYQHAQTYCTCGPGLRLTVKTSQSPVSVLLLTLRSGKPLSAKAHPRYWVAT